MVVLSDTWSVPCENLEGIIRRKISGRCLKFQAEAAGLTWKEGRYHHDGQAQRSQICDPCPISPGKEVIVDGVAEVKEVSESQRRHYAEDAGQSKRQMMEIKGSERQIVFMASGVKVK